VPFFCCFVLATHIEHLDKLEHAGVQHLENWTMTFTTNAKEHYEDVDAIRTELETKHGQVWSTEELRRAFVVIGFCMGLVVVNRKSDGVGGSLAFDHMPRFYYDFRPE
jgi:hypothetical protein